MNLEPEQFVLYGCLFVAVILHEISHGVLAFIFGDDTAKRAGRLTLNPLKHIDPFGSLILPAMLVLSNHAAFGWAKPVPVNPSRLRNPRQHMLFVGLVGPFSNFALMAAAAFAARHITGGTSIDLRFVLVGFALMNLYLGIFNLLPIPPLDGSSLIERVLPAKWLPTWWKIRPYGFLILILGAMSQSFNFLEDLIRPFENALFTFSRG